MPNFPTKVATAKVVCANAVAIVDTSLTSPAPSLKHHELVSDEMRYYVMITVQIKFIFLCFRYYP